MKLVLDYVYNVYKRAVKLMKVRKKDLGQSWKRRQNKAPFQSESESNTICREASLAMIVLVGRNVHF